MHSWRDFAAGAAAASGGHGSTGGESTAPLASLRSGSQSFGRGAVARLAVVPPQTAGRNAGWGAVLQVSPLAVSKAINLFIESGVLCESSQPFHSINFCDIRRRYGPPGLGHLPVGGVQPGGELFSR